MISYNEHIYTQIVDEVNLAGLNNLKSFGYNDDLQVNIFYKNIKFLRSIFFVQADRVEESNNVAKGFISRRFIIFEKL